MFSRQSVRAGGKGVSLTHSPLPPLESVSDTQNCYMLSRPQGHSAAGRVRSKKNSSGTNVNRTCDLPAFSALPQIKAPSRTPHCKAENI